MTLRHMIIFRTVCECNYNTTKAAKNLHMTQPAVSLAIKELEQYYDILLFDRIGRRLKINDAGQLFLQYAIHISDMFNDMETGLREWNSKGLLHVGASFTIGSQFLPEYVKEFSKFYPDIDLKVTVEQSDKLEHKILKNELDCALIEDIPHSKKLVATSYCNDKLSVFCSAEKGWVQGQTISKEEFSKQRFLLRESGSGTRELFNRVMEQAGIHIVPSWEAASTSAIINAVVADIGIGVLPLRLIQDAINQGLIVTVNVENLDFDREFYIIYHKDKFLTPAARKFISICKEYVQE